MAIYATLEARTGLSFELARYPTHTISRAVIGAHPWAAVFPSDITTLLGVADDCQHHTWLQRYH